MNPINWFKLPNSKITEKDLPAVKFLNRKSFSGQIYSEPIFEDYLIEGKGEDGYIWNLICQIRNWHFSKFKYNNLPKGLNKTVLENNLLVYGRVALFKYGDGYKSFPFKIDTVDMDGFPKNITVYAPGDLNYEKKLTVGKNAVIIVNNNDGLIFTINNSPFFGPIWRVWSLIMDVVNAKKAMGITYKINIPRIAIMDVEPEERELLRASLENVDFLFDYDAKGYATEGRLKGDVVNNIFQTESRITDMTTNFQNYLEILYTALGINHNPNNNKKERQINMEVQSNNQILTSQIETELEVREQRFEIFNEIFNENVIIELNEIFKKDGELEPEENNEDEQTNI